MEIIKKFEPLFGEWHADSFIGTGSFGRVYKIYRDEAGKRFYSAMKYISIPQNESEITQMQQEGYDDNSISQYYSDLVKQFISENEIMNRLQGLTNIVSYSDSRMFPKPDRMGYDIFIRMELLTSLPSRMQGKPLDRNEIMKIGIDICSALIICKKENIIHRDIKPDNIFVNAQGNYKLGDFGIARYLDNAASAMSKKGTYNYMAPEVYKGQKYGANCDIYSLGLMLYYLLNGNRLPFLPPAPQLPSSQDREDALVKRMSETCPMPKPRDAQDALGDVILKACAYNPEDRFASAAEMREALERVQKDEKPTDVPSFTPPSEKKKNEDLGHVQSGDKTAHILPGHKAPSSHAQNGDNTVHILPGHKAPSSPVQEGDKTVHILSGVEAPSSPVQEDDKTVHILSGVEAPSSPMQEDDKTAGIPSSEYEENEDSVDVEHDGNTATIIPGVNAPSSPMQEDDKTADIPSSEESVHTPPDLSPDELVKISHMTNSEIHTMRCRKCNSVGMRIKVPGRAWIYTISITVCSLLASEALVFPGIIVGYLIALLISSIRSKRVNRIVICNECEYAIVIPPVSHSEKDNSDTIDQ